MSNTVELGGGFINRITLDRSNGIVKKEFLSGNGIEKATAKRLVSEWQSLRQVSFTPVGRQRTDTAIWMNYLDGEKSLDAAVRSYPEATAADVYCQAGTMLGKIHQVVRVHADGYHVKHQQKYVNLLKRTGPDLEKKGISTLAVYEYFKDSYDAKEIEKNGLVWTHGDYWLNNFIGQRVNGHFRLNGIIDWELAGLGSPYEDFAIVKTSITDQHPIASTPFWKGYGQRPKIDLLHHYANVKALEWMAADGPETRGDYDSPFYQHLLSELKKSI